MKRDTAIVWGVLGFSYSAWSALENRQVVSDPTRTVEEQREARQKMYWGLGGVTITSALLYLTYTRKIAPRA